MNSRTATAVFASSSKTLRPGPTDLEEAAPVHSFDAYAPGEMARRVRESGVAKAGRGVLDTLALSILAGAFIAVGAAFATVTMTDTGVGFGLTRLAGGVAFSLGLILVVVAGAELFTGNNLVAMAWASRVVSTRLLLRNWVLVYVGNLIGAVATAALMVSTGTWSAAGGRVGETAVRIAAAKAQLPFGEALARGVLCNALVCLAVWLCQSGRSTTDKILAIVWPIAAFVALGFEHSVANMYFIPYGIMLHRRGVGPGGSGIARAEGLDLGGFVSNLVPVTIGNILGGTLLVAAIYWFVYLRRESGSR